MMTDVEMDSLAEKIAAKMMHANCPLGMDADAVEAARMLGAAHAEVKPRRSSYVLVLRFGDELTNFGIRLLHWTVVGLAVISVALLGLFGIPHLAKLFGR